MTWYAAPRAQPRDILRRSRCRACRSRRTGRSAPGRSRLSRIMSPDSELSTTSTPRPSGAREHLVGPNEADARVEHVPRRRWTSNMLALFRRPGGGEHLRAHRARHLHGRQSDAPRRRRGSARARPRPELGHGAQRVPRRHERDGNRGRFLEGPRRAAFAPPDLRRAVTWVAKLPAATATTASTWRQALDARADGRDDSRALAAEWPRIARVQTQHIEDVLEVQTDSPGPRSRPHPGPERRRWSGRRSRLSSTPGRRGEHLGRRAR